MLVSFLESVSIRKRAAFTGLFTTREENKVQTQRQKFSEFLSLPKKWKISVYHSHDVCLYEDGSR